MHMKSTIFVASVLPFLAAATPLRRNEPASSCNTGPVQCCNSVQSADSKSIAGLLSVLGVVVSDLTVFVGANCSPISVIGVGGNSCSASPVCCENNSFGGLIALGCVPVDLSL
ncbi:hypothetical protein HGRIS_009306 [Hohenbuehelia grisea]|uniref:Hydrophobin n=1 Tax=Hohenbuehelia grisea TaxID=104357 RepID=A0ABR3J0X2_9AGAR